MNKAQESGYWRRWAAACKVQGWKSSDTDRRHAVHISALKYNKSHIEFNNKETGKVFRAFEALAGSDTARISKDLDPDHDADQRRRLVYGCRSIFWEDYILKIADHKFGTSDWTHLPLSKLGQLQITLTERSRAQEKGYFERYLVTACEQLKPARYIEAICQRRCGASDYRALPLEKLRQLHQFLGNAALKDMGNGEREFVLQDPHSVHRYQVPALRLTQEILSDESSDYSTCSEKGEGTTQPQCPIPIPSGPEGP